MTLTYILYYILHQFDVAFEGVCSLRDLEMSIHPLSDKEIKKNMSDLEKKLTVDLLEIYFLLV